MKILDAMVFVGAEKNLMSAVFAMVTGQANVVAIQASQKTVQASAAARRRSIPAVFVVAVDQTNVASAAATEKMNAGFALRIQTSV